MGHFGISYIGIIYMLMIEIPNLIWAKNKPRNYNPSNENKILLIFERCGQVLCTTSILIFSDTNPQAFSPWTFWLLLSIALMLIYEGYFYRYFRGEHSLEDFYSSYLGFPLPGASLPVLAFFFLGIYGRLIWLIISSIILGIGHIGIHLQHFKNLKK